MHFYNVKVKQRYDVSEDNSGGSFQPHFYLILTLERKKKSYKCTVPSDEVKPYFRVIMQTGNSYIYP